MRKITNAQLKLPKDMTSMAVLQFLEAVNTPKSLAIALLFKYNQHLDIRSIQCDPLHYRDTDLARFRKDYAAICLLKKADFLETGIDLKEVAYEKFYRFEDRCEAYNDKIKPACAGGFIPPSAIDNSIPAVIDEIAKILGPLKPHLDSIAELANWGPGVSTLLKGSTSIAANKFQSETGITRDLYALVGDRCNGAHFQSSNTDTNLPDQNSCGASSVFQAAYPSWFRDKAEFTMQVGNKLCTVPKDSRADRIIAIEPGFNLWFQKGIGAVLKRILRRSGLRLDDQSVNQKLAAIAYRDSLATIDFSSASDSIARYVVKLLLPSDWYSIMEMSRSHFGQTPGENPQPIRWQKFSSMGNGFTFELESLIFYAIARVACRKTYSRMNQIAVYGDDVILPRSAVPEFHRITATLGFIINNEKSYTDGLFFESCGKHYFCGVDVTPIYLKERVSCVPSLFKHHNSVLRLAHRWAGLRGIDVRFRPLIKQLRAGCPKDLHFGISEGYGDGGFIKNIDEACPSVARDTQKTERHVHFTKGPIIVAIEKVVKYPHVEWEGYFTPHLTQRPVSLPFDGFGLTLARLRSISSFMEQSDSSKKLEVNELSLKGQYTSSKNRLYVQQWYNLGQWVTPIH